MIGSEPEWDEEGQPVNETAVLADSLEWLALLNRRFDDLFGTRFAEDRERLNRTIAAVETRLPAEWLKKYRAATPRRRH